MDYIGIALIIITVVGSVNFVHRHAHKVGVEAGIAKGRLQILEENIIRESNKKDPMVVELQRFVNEKEVRIEKKRA